MDEVTIIAVGGNEVVDKVITGVTGGEYSHVAIQTNGHIVEALGEKENADPYPGIWERDFNKYDSNPYAKFIKVKVPNKKAGDKWLESVIGTPYAYIGCLAGGLSELLDTSLPCDGQLTMNCSELVTRYLRKCGLDLLPKTFADSATPADDVKALA